MDLPENTILVTVEVPGNESFTAAVVYGHSEQLEQAALNEAVKDALEVALWSIDRVAAITKEEG